MTLSQGSEQKTKGIRYILYSLLIVDVAFVNLDRVGGGWHLYYDQLSPSSSLSVL